MRLLLLPFLLITNAFAQHPAPSCKSVDDISVMERLAHERLSATGAYGASAASTNFDIKYLRLEWEVDPSVNYIKGKVTAYFVMTATATNISFDLMAGFQVDSVKRRGVTLTKNYQNNFIDLIFPASIPAGTLDSVSIYYQGIPPNTGFGSFVQTTHAGVPVIWTLSEPFGSRDWWPCKNGLDDKTDSIDVMITTPVAYTAASNGLLQSEIINGTKKITHWKHRYPIASYLICMAVTNYSVFNNSVQLGNKTLPMQTFCYPENLAQFQANTPLVLNTLQFYHNTVSDYPFINEKYGHVQFGWGGGMEHQTSTFIIIPDENLMAHELGHQWFGDKVTCASWQDVWLNEGFATHMASMYWEQKYPAVTLTNRKNEIANITSVVNGSVRVDDTTSVNRIFSSRLSYIKGSHLLYMLRFILGDAIFFAGIREYLKDPALAYGFAKTSDLKRNLEKVSGKDLTKFFDQWFVGEGYPSFTVKWSPTGNGYAKINISQITSHSSVPFFNIPVPLLFKNATQQKTVVIESTSNTDVFFRNIGFVADTVIVDPDYWLISKNNSSQKVTDNAAANTIQVFPNPVSDQLYVYFRNYNLPSATMNVYNAAGQMVYSKTISVNGSSFEEIPFIKFARGVYIIKVQSGNDVKYISKIVK